MKVCIAGEGPPHWSVGRGAEAVCVADRVLRPTAKRARKHPFIRQSHAPSAAAAVTTAAAAVRAAAAAAAVTVEDAPQQEGGK